MPIPFPDRIQYTSGEIVMRARYRVVHIRRKPSLSFPGANLRSERLPIGFSGMWNWHCNIEICGPHWRCCGPLYSVMQQSTSSNSGVELEFSGVDVGYMSRMFISRTSKLNLFDRRSFDSFTVSDVGRLSVPNGYCFG
jgi:hypothetical protein